MCSIQLNRLEFKWGNKNNDNVCQLISVWWQPCFEMLHGASGKEHVGAGILLYCLGRTLRYICIFQLFLPDTYYILHLSKILKLFFLCLLHKCCCHVHEFQCCIWLAYGWSLHIYICKYFLVYCFLQGTKYTKDYRLVLMLLGNNPMYQHPFYPLYNFPNIYSFAIWLWRMKCKSHIKVCVCCMHSNPSSPHTSCLAEVAAATHYFINM